ncbi:RagB/SusD family nutrient uptake outer membrane protein [Parabacteroides sp. Marseille-P3160]|uniref:RagB/SusD family nutrient uptake outer membrane protein n=1 Tax=Parabacteroides sp. Marseille-P3160 TaxID=1917887 RepID=UPI0009BBDFF4|nr:RagB/SusD family nutrient uptake outer membrane protein [Parabacteroides sp. Marseille-P3160]
MKHKYIIISIVSLILLILQSCGDSFLSKNPQGSISQEALENLTGIELLVTDAYASLAARTDNYEPYQASPFNWTFGGIYGGDANKGSDPGDQSVVNEIERYNILSTNIYLSSKWGWAYNAVKRVNIALQTIAKVEGIDDATLTSRLGELKFLRALFYFEAVRVFGSYIPWVDETNTENDPKVHNDIDIYPNILDDINEAIENLPNTQSEVGRANVWAAYALKAKILMHKGDLAAAKPILKEILENGVTSNGLHYALEEDLNANFNALTENGKESIFAVQYAAKLDMGNAAFCLNYPHNSGPGGCCGFYQPSFELVNSFQVDANGLPYLNGEYRTKPTVSRRGGNNEAVGVNDNTIPVDPRLDFAVGRYGIPYKDWGYPADDWVRNPVNGGIFMPKKHVFSKAEKEAGMTTFFDGWAPGSAMNMEYLSVRDMILLYAECLANDGELVAAMEQVNKIRTRASLDVNIIKLGNGAPAANYKIATYPSSHAAFSNKDLCIKAIRMERKLELAMESERWFDLVRWGGDYMASELKAYIDYEKQYISKFAGASYLPASKTMFPIPDDQILIMGNDENGKPYLVQQEPWK